MPRYANLIFDLDGTITDSKISITACIEYVLASLNVQCPPPSDLDWCIGPSLAEIFGRLLASSDTTLINRAVDLYLARFEVEGFCRTTVYQGLEDLLKELKKQGCGLFLATAKLGDHGQLVLSHFGLLQFFSATYGSLRDGSVRTKSQLVRSVLSREHLEPLTTAMIGDRAHDMIAARENGVAAIAVGYGYGTRFELEAAGAEAIFESPESLSMFLRSDP
jgi:phosphoglycolate phosphatase